MLTKKNEFTNYACQTKINYDMLNSFHKYTKVWEVGEEKGEKFGEREEVKALAFPLPKSSNKQKIPVSTSRFKRHHRFTLVELLVVIAIISVLAGMLLPVLQNAREVAHSIRCVGNLKQMSSAILIYTTENNDYLPYSADDRGIPINFASRKAPISKILNYNIWSASTYQDSNANHIFNCPSAADYNSWRDYIANRRVMIYMPPDTSFVKVSSIKHASKTILIGDNNTEEGFGNYSLFWESNYQERLSIRHSGGLNIAFVDWHIEWINKNKVTSTMIVP